MDHLYSKLSTYELDYTDDINKKMRVPEKLSYDSDNSATLSEGHDVSFRNYPVADLSGKLNCTYFAVLDAKRSSEYAPGYSPDILNNSDIRSKLICNAQAHASSQSADGSAKANASAGVFCETSSHRAQERLRVSKSSSTGDNEHVSIDHRLIRLEKRISHLEFQQALMKGGLTVYILYRILRWVIKNS
uniref:Miff domain-containing protein n=1 Tax=Schistosoma mansoni TaxID=6183 RepID=A0A5K4F3G8_SCHMA